MTAGKELPEVLVVTIFRLEQLCKERGQKVPLRLKNSVTTFSLDLEDLNPLSPSLECHIEVSTHQPNSGKVNPENAIAI